eukprot:scaffold20864_cov72-Phaeocystis_antarctica.AAC.8
MVGFVQAQEDRTAGELTVACHSHASGCRTVCSLAKHELAVPGFPTYQRFASAGTLRAQRSPCMWSHLCHPGECGEVQLGERGAGTKAFVAKRGEGRR